MINFGRKLQSSVVAVVLVAIMVLTVPSGAHAVGQPAVRFVPIPVKVVIIGFDENQVDASYLTWSGDSKNLPDLIPNGVLGGNTTGVTFRPQYSVTFAPSSFRQSFVSYLHSIEKQTHGKNPWFQQAAVDKSNPEYYNRNPVAVDYVVYDANSVEDWLWNHAQDLGGYPDNGWTVIVAYLPELPSVTWKDVKAFEGSNGAVLPKSKPHYYGISHTDADLGYAYRYRDFMNAWGGHHRVWYVDFSAGPVFNSQWTDLPLQVVMGDNNIDISKGFGKTWLTEYMSDYVWEATYNFVTPYFVYYPQYKPKYQIDIFILDDRASAEKQSVAIQSTVNKDMVTAAFQELVPYSTVTVNLSFPDVSDDLHNLIKASYKYTDSWLLGADFGQPERYGVVDIRPVYKYMLDNFATFEKNPRLTQDTMTVPVFAFAFSNQTYFTYAYKWFIGDTDWETGALLGIALPEAAFVSVNQWVFTRGDQIDPPQLKKGEGFTQTIIHEVGHEFSLMHPHQFGDEGDFVYSAMGYFTDDYKFGQIDKDALQRAHVDQLYLDTLNLLASSSATDLVNQARNKLSEVDSAYAKMNYADAVQPVLAAHQLAEQAAPQTGPTQTLTQGQTQTSGPPVPSSESTMIYLVVGIIVGLVIGLAIAMVVKRSKKPS